MTGWGEAEADLGAWQLRVECRSVNHRNLDVRLTVPRELVALESVLHQLLKARFSRGRVELRLHLSASPTAAPTQALVDKAKFRRVCDQLRALKRDHGLGGELQLGEVLRFRDELVPEQGDVALPEAEAIAEVVYAAIEDLAGARAREGAVLADELERLLAALSEEIDRAEAIRPELLESYRARMKQRVEEALAQYGGGEAQLDEGKLIAELAFVAERSDVAEEIARARAHIAHVHDLLSHDEPAALGKKIDFYLQELIREANTLGSKSFDQAMTEVAVNSKSLVEQMREQAANIE